MEFKSYQKIENAFGYDPKGRVPFLTPEFESLGGLEVIGFEKVDGTNIRMCWDGYSFELKGRTDKSQIPVELEDKMWEIFNESVCNAIEREFGETPVVFCGEGFGRKIQENGEKYKGDGADFVLFDIMVNGIYLKYQDVIEMAEKYGFNMPKMCYKGYLKDTIDWVRHNTDESYINPSHEMEGIVVRPSVVELYDKKGHRLLFKVRRRDVKKYDLNK